jgi:subfamily B ATP-binding cassette protein MsbA
MKLYFRILSFGKPFLGKGLLGFFFLFLANLFGTLSIALVIPFLQILFQQDGASAIIESARITDDPTLMQEAYMAVDELIRMHDKWWVLTRLCMALGVSIFFKSVCRYLSSYFIAPFEQGVIQTMRSRLFDHLKMLSMAFYTGKRKGGIINVMVNDVQIIQESVIGTVQNVVSDPIQMLLILTSLFLISWKLTLFTLLVLPATGWFVSRIAKTLKKKARSGQEKLGMLISVLDEFISGIRVVKAFGAEGYEQKRYEGINMAYRDLMISLKRRSDLASPVTELMSILVVIGVILYGGNLILAGQGELEASAFIGFIALFGSFIQPIKTFSNALSRIQRGVASFQRVEEFLQIPEDVKEAPDAKSAHPFRESVCYEQVSFSYEKEPVLREINIRLEKGKTVALVGPSGAGKSTLADLLQRFYDPTNGRVTIDGVDIRTLKVDDLRAMIGVVTQEGILFNESILQNIAYGDPNPDLGRAEIAAKAAHAHTFIEKLPEGYHTHIGERGTKLSGGQRQRISIARALYKDAPILILDEATSALDSESERLVQDALDQLRANRTSLVIAHRLSTIRNADHIYVMEEGKVVENGTHDELMDLKGKYHQLYAIQFQAN